MSISRGFESGFNVTSKALKGREERKLKEALAQESARFDVTEGAFGPELDQNIQQLRGLQAQDPGQAAIYDQSIQELERRRGLTAPDFSIGSRATNFGTREEAEDAAVPMRTRGVANVFRQAGEIEKADEATGRAMQQEAAGLQLGKARRQAEADTRMGLFDTWTAENPGADLAAMKNAAKEFKLSSDQVLGVTARMAGLQENELKLWKGEVQNVLKGKSDAEIVDLFNTDDRFDPTTDMERKVGRDGSVTLTLKRKDGTVVSTYKAPDAATATAYLRKQALEPETLADWLLDRKKTETTIAASQAAAANSRRGGESTLARRVSEAEQQFGRKLTPEEISTLAGLTGRSGAAREPTVGDINALTRMYIDNDQSGTLTVPQARALALSALTGGPGPAVDPATAALANALDGAQGDPFAREAPAAPTTPPAPVVPRPVSGARPAPSPAAARALQTRGIGALTSADVVEAAAAAGNPAAVTELQRRQASAARAERNTLQQQRGLGM